MLSKTGLIDICSYALALSGFLAYNRVQNTIREHQSSPMAVATSPFLWGSWLALTLAVSLFIRASTLPQITLISLGCLMGIVVLSAHAKLSGN